MKLILKDTEQKIGIPQINALEEQLKIKLPNAYINFILENNGGIPNKIYFSENEADLVVNFFLSISENKFNIKEYYTEFVLENNYIPNNYLPIGEDCFGNIICIYCGYENYGNIFIWNHENCSLRLVASSFDYLIDNLSDV